MAPVTPSQPCQGFNADGSPCPSTTKSVDGYCKRHRNSADKLIRQMIATCEPCPIEDCEVRGVAPGGRCWYQIMDLQVRPESMADIVEEQFKTVEKLSLIKDRLMREVAGASFDKDRTNALATFTRLHTEALEKLADAKGWGKAKREVSAERKQKRMEKGMSRGIDREVVEVTVDEDALAEYAAEDRDDGIDSHEQDDGRRRPDSE